MRSRNRTADASTTNPRLAQYRWHRDRRQGGEDGEEGGAARLSGGNELVGIEPAGGAARGEQVTFTGYLSDTRCIGEINQRDRINVTLDAPQHTKLCLEECMEFGFTVLVNVGTTGHPVYKAQYQFNAAGNNATSQIIASTCVTQGIQVTGTGTVGWAAGWMGLQVYNGQPLGDYIRVESLAQVGGSQCTTTDNADDAAATEAAVVAGGVGGGALLLVIAGRYVYRRRGKDRRDSAATQRPRRPRRPRRDGTDKNDHLNSGSGGWRPSLHSDGGLSRLVSSLRGSGEWLATRLSREPVIPRELIRSSIACGVTIGEGQFANVFHGNYRDGQSSTEIAVKVLKEDAGDDGQMELLKEAIVMAQFRHLNVIQIIGVATNEMPYFLCLEYCHGGSLRDALRHGKTSRDANGHGSGSNDGSESGSVPPARLTELVGYCQGVAEGMHYLTTEKFVHRDLAARNVLLDIHKNAKIADFGLSRDVEHSSYYRRKTHETPLPVRWMSPEAIQEGLFSHASDAWAYGVTCIEIFTGGDLPYGRMLNGILIERVIGGYRLPMPAFCPEGMYDQIIEPCFDMDIQTRISFDVIVGLLRAASDGSNADIARLQQVGTMRSEEFGYTVLSSGSPGLSRVTEERPGGVPNPNGSRPLSAPPGIAMGSRSSSFGQLVCDRLSVLSCPSPRSNADTLSLCSGAAGPFRQSAPVDGIGDKTERYQSIEIETAGNARRSAPPSVTSSSAGPCIDGGPSVDAPSALSIERDVHGHLQLTPPYDASPRYQSVDVEHTEHTEPTEGPLPTVRVTSLDSDDAGVVAGGARAAGIDAAVGQQQVAARHCTGPPASVGPTVDIPRPQNADRLLPVRRSTAAGSPPPPPGRLSKTSVSSTLSQKSQI